MLTDYNHYTIFSHFFRYPEPDFKDKICEYKNILMEKYTEELKVMDVFFNYFDTTPLSNIEENYIRTFDVQATCYLDIGYVLFGEDYKRGAFLVKMNEEQTKVNNNCGYELADHLPNVLTLIPKINDEENKTEICTQILYPAIERMIKSFKESENVYKYAFKGLLNIIKTDFKNINFRDTVFPTDFMNGFGGIQSNSCSSLCSKVNKTPVSNF